MKKRRNNYENYGKSKRRNKHKKIVYKEENFDYLMSRTDFAELILNEGPVLIAIAILIYQLTQSVANIFGVFIGVVFLVGAIIIFFLAKNIYKNECLKNNVKYKTVLVNSYIMMFSTILSIITTDEKIISLIVGVLGIFQIIISIKRIINKYTCNSINNLNNEELFFIFNGVIIYLGANIDFSILNYIILILSFLGITLCIISGVITKKKSKVYKVNSQNISSIFISCLVILSGIILKYKLIQSTGKIFLTIIIGVFLISIINFIFFDLDKIKSNEKMFNLKGQCINIYNIITILAFAINSLDIKNIFINDGIYGILCVIIFVIFFKFENLKNLFICIDKKRRLKHHKTFIRALRA